MSAWIGTICGVIGALLVAMNNGYQNIGYMFFLVGSWFSLTAAFKEKNKPNMVLWAVFFSVNLFGLFNYA